MAGFAAPSSPFSGSLSRAVAFFGALAFSPAFAALSAGASSAPFFGAASAFEAAFFGAASAFEAAFFASAFASALFARFSSRASSLFD